MAQVFISYSSLDEAQAIAIADLLESHDIHCWLACKNLPIGSNFSSTIPDVIRESPIFLLLLSKNAVASMDVLNELTLACRYRNQRNRLILPLQLEPMYIPNAFDYHLATVQIHPFSFSEDLCSIELIGTIRKHLSPRTDMDNMWGSSMEVLRTQILHDMEQEMDSIDPDELVVMNGLLDYMRTAPPKEFLELMCEIMDFTFLNDESAVKQFQNEFVQVLNENNGKIPADFARLIPSLKIFMENASPEETSWFYHGFISALSDADLDPDDIIE